MEQLTIDFPDSSSTFELVFQEILKCISEKGYPTDVIRLKPLAQGNTINVMVLEKIMCKIAKKQDDLFVLCRLRFQREANDSHLFFEPDKTLANFIRIPLNSMQTISSFTEVLLAAYKSAYRENADVSFGCCSRFIECSDARKCTNPNRIFALGCAYKDNLENGRVFYGRNPTV